MKARDVQIEKWVCKINRLARSMDDAIDGVHPSTWPEMMREANEKFRKVARSRP